MHIWDTKHDTSDMEKLDIIIFLIPTLVNIVEDSHSCWVFFVGFFFLGGGED